MSFQRVLVATDFSDNSAAAATLGSTLAADDATYRIVHVMPEPLRLPFLGPEKRGDLERATEQDRAARTERLERLREEAGLRDAELEVRAGGVAEEVATAAEEFGADLVVIAAHRHSFAERALLGSKAKGIVRAVEPPVLVGKTHEVQPSGRLRRIGVSTDFYAAAERAGRYAADLAQEHGAELLAIHAVHPDLWAGAMTPAEPSAAGGAVAHVDPDWLQRTMGQMLHRYNEETLEGRGREVLRPGEPVRAVSALVDEEDVDLLVVGTHGPGTLERVLIGSVAEGLVDRAPCSVLVVGKRG